MYRKRTQYLFRNTVVRCRGRDDKVGSQIIYLSGDYGDGISAPALGFVFCTEYKRLIGFKNQASIYIENSNPDVGMSISANVYGTPFSTPIATNAFVGNLPVTFISVKPGDYLGFCASSEDVNVTMIALFNQTNSLSFMTEFPVEFL